MHLHLFWGVGGRGFENAQRKHILRFKSIIFNRVQSIYIKSHVYAYQNNLFFILMSFSLSAKWVHGFCITLESMHDVAGLLLTLHRNEKILIHWMLWKVRPQQIMFKDNINELFWYLDQYLVTYIHVVKLSRENNLNFKFKIK